MDPSKQGLLNERRSFGDGDSDSDIDATEFLDADVNHSTAVSSPRKPFAARRRPGNFAALQRPFRTRTRCCACALVSIIVIWIVITGGGFFAYKKYTEAPPDGLSPPWYPSPAGGIARSWADSYAKAAKMVSRMTLPEKVNVTTGTGWRMGFAVGTNGPAVHVGFPQLNLQDGPLGIRFADNITAFPAGVTVGATWSRRLMYERGRAHGEEARLKGINALLGPCVGPLGRMPAGGRNWEGFGADPYLQGVAGAETIRGIQSQNVMATIKHFVANEQEHFRQSWEWGLPNALSANIDDRAMHELYAWPFGDAVKAGVASVMCSYNMVNNSYACGNSKLLNGILKDELGFQGFVMSDWLAQRSGVASALAGLDMTMPGDGLKWEDGISLWGPQLTRAVLNGSVPVDRLNDMVTRIVAAWYQLGQDDKEIFDGKGPNFSSWTNEKLGLPYTGSPSKQDKIEVNAFIDVQGNHSSVAKEVATEGIVLLKNEGSVLPLSRNGNKKRATKRQGGKQMVGVFGEDGGPGNGPNYCKDRGCNQGTLASGWGSGAVEFPYLVAPIEALGYGFDKSKVELTAHLTNHPEVADIESQDVCIVFANADSGEGFLKWSGVGGDRNDLQLQKGGDNLVIQVAQHCGGDTIVVVHAVGPVVIESWIDLPGVKAVLWANLPGQESGNALADVLFGVVSPSGRLPYTIGKSLADYGPGGQVMYLPNGVVPQQDFSEGLYVDYRYFDKYNIQPRFPFGFGLAYTEFTFTNLTVTPLKTKSALPSARPPNGAEPPVYNPAIPDAKEALFPAGFRRFEKYIYPYIDSVDEIVSEPYPYPDGYHTKQPLSGAGGDEGGNPDLWETYVTVSVDVANVGPVGAQAVPQLYLGYPQDASDVDFPVKVLRGFDKLYIDAGETKSVQFNITRRDLSYWDVVAQNWVMVTGGEYRFMVGTDAGDLPLSSTW